MRAHALPAAGAAAVAILVAGAAVQTTLGQTAKELRPVSSFDAIADQRARSIALFEEAGRVLQHPRCVNCHPATERPLQTEAMRPHQPLVVRGPDGHGAPGMACNTCHRAANYEPARVPGHPEWHLAPASMAWEGRTLGEICEQIKDPARNGGKDMAALIHHHGRGFARRLGLVAGRRPRVGAGHAEGIRRSHQGLGRNRRRLPDAVRVAATGPVMRGEPSPFLAVEPAPNACGGPSMKARILWAAAIAAVLALPVTAEAQGVIGGAQQGAAAGHRAAGPVGAAVGGVVGGVTGGVVGGVRGAIGAPQHTGTVRKAHRKKMRHHARR